MTTRSAYDMFFNADGSYKSTEQYLAETDPAHYTLTARITHTVVCKDGAVYAILRSDSLAQWMALSAEMYREDPPF